MQLRMIFGTILPPPTPEADPLELKCGSTVTVEDTVGAALVDAGRAEVFPIPAPTKGKA